MGQSCPLLRLPRSQITTRRPSARRVSWGATHSPRVTHTSEWATRVWSVQVRPPSRERAHMMSEMTAVCESVRR